MNKPLDLNKVLKKKNNTTKKETKKEGIDIILVKYFNSKKEKKHFNKLCEHLSSFKETRVIIEDNTIDNIGLTKARNEGFAKANSKAVCFMDFDINIKEIDWNLLAKKALEKDVGVVCPALNKRDKIEWHYGNYAHPHLMIIDSDKFRKIGGFREDYFVAYADWDLYRRCLSNKLSIVQHGNSVIQHIGFSKGNKNRSYLWHRDRLVYKNYWEDNKRP